MCNGVTHPRNVFYMAIEYLTKKEFLAKVAKAGSAPGSFVFLGDKAAVIDFYADWCPPCNALAPIFAELADEYDEKVDFYKVNVNEENELAALFDIRSIPTLILFARDGHLQRVVGALDRAHLKKLVEGLLPAEA